MATSAGGWQGYRWLSRDAAPGLEAALQAAASSVSLGGAHGEHSTSWDFGELPTVFEPEWNGRRLRGYPALFDEGDGVSLRVFSDEQSSRRRWSLGRGGCCCSTYPHAASS